MQRPNDRGDYHPAVSQVKVLALQAGEFTPAGTRPCGGQDESRRTDTAQADGPSGDLENLFRSGPRSFQALAVQLSTTSSALPDGV